MNGNLMYEMTRQRIAEQQRAVQRAAEAHERRAAARGRRGKAEASGEIATPAIPDFADDMFGAARDAVPVPREEKEDMPYRHAQTDC
jgi:hypothetical protein